MELITDTNILFSFFRENPVRDIITHAQFFGLEIITPEFALEELWNHKKDLLKYTKVSEQNVEWIFEQLKNFITIIPQNEFIRFMEKAQKISPDKKDTPFFALALYLNSSIWSNEPRLKKQAQVKVFSTFDLRKYLHYI